MVRPRYPEPAVFAAPNRMRFVAHAGIFDVWIRDHIPDPTTLWLVVENGIAGEVQRYPTWVNVEGYTYHNLPDGTSVLYKLTPEVRAQLTVMATLLLDESVDHDDDDTYDDEYSGYNDEPPMSEEDDRD
jgi:hypothetical protein